MARKTKTLSLALIFVIAAGVAVYASLFAQSGRYTVLEHVFRVDPLSLALVTVAAFVLIAVLWITIAQTKPRAASRDAGPVLTRGLVALLPLLLLSLSPALLSNYLTREDLRTRLAILGALVLTAFLALMRDRLRRAAGRISISFFDATNSRSDR